MATGIWNGASADPTLEANWTGISTFANGDVLIVPANATVDMNGGDMTAEAEFSQFIVENGCSIAIGSASTPLNISVDNGDKLIDFGGTGVAYLDIDNADNVTIRNAGTTQTSGVNPLNLTGSSNTNLNIITGSASIGVAANAGETAAFTNINVNGGTVYLGRNVTTTAINQTSGIIDALSGCTNLTLDEGTFYQREGGITNPTVNGGTLYYNSDDTITTLVVYGSVDVSGGIGGLTITNATIYKGGSINDQYERATFTNGIDIANCRIADVTLDLGQNFTITKSAI